jgi:ABC-type multidrug transport system ATPase subunit
MIYRFYGMFRGTPKAMMKTAVDALLTDVDLLSRAHGPAGTFSGGMKRRLSMAIACMGLPNIILLDEPTTGLDPLAKKKIWNLIQAMKRQERVVLLTTHSMEEADVLSDRIAMLSKGTLRASGTALFLKNRFGLGYNAKLLCESDRLEELQSIIHTHLPSAEVSSNQ